MDFMTGLFISTNWKRDSYNSIQVIVDWLTKIIHYKPVKITINAQSQIEVIIDMVVWHYGFPYLIMANKGLLFILKFWSLLFYFFDIKQWFFITFYR